MSDRLSRPRADPDLPPGYQFGDARPAKELHAPGALDRASLSYRCSCGGRWYLGQHEPFHVDPELRRVRTAPSDSFPPWRAPAENAAERLTRIQQEHDDTMR